MKALGIVRDIVLVVGVVAIAVATWWSRVDEHRTEQARRERLGAVIAAIGDLETIYTRAMFNDPETRGIWQQVFRQNDVLVQYDKLALMENAGASLVEIQAVMDRAGVANASAAGSQ